MFCGIYDRANKLGGLMRKRLLIASLICFTLALILTSQIRAQENPFKSPLFDSSVAANIAGTYYDYWTTREGIAAGARESNPFARRVGPGKWAAVTSAGSVAFSYWLWNRCEKYDHTRACKVAVLSLNFGIGAMHATWGLHNKSCVSSGSCIPH